MNTRFLFRGIETDYVIQDYILKRLQRLVKLVDPVSQFEIEVNTKNKQGDFRVEIMIKTPEVLYRAEEASASVEGSTDMVIDELEAQITKQKNKHHDLSLRGKRSFKKKIVVDKSARL
ncbi:MAG: ribosome hibernation-promoting factor, HPF/YfiA family [Minisyncoccota bacterium]